MLKTSLMFLYQEHKENGDVMDLGEFDWTGLIYRKIIVFMSRPNRKFPSYYGDGVLFQCGHAYTDSRADRVCCQKRSLILRMCNAILTWLHANRAELEELQELYPALRLEVYNRRSLHCD